MRHRSEEPIRNHCLEPRVLLEPKAEVNEYLRCAAEEARLNMWTSVRYMKQVLGHFVKKGALSTVCMCMCFRLMPKDDILWYVGRNCSPKGEEVKKQLATRILLCLL